MTLGWDTIAILNIPSTSIMPMPFDSGNSNIPMGRQSSGRAVIQNRYGAKRSILAWRGDRGMDGVSSQAMGFLLFWQL
jgi:hypothetical protein